MIEHEQHAALFGESDRRELLRTAEGGVTCLRLNRPSRANAYTDAVLAALDDELNRLRMSDTERALVVTGAGQRAFCAGADRGGLTGRRALQGLYLRSRTVFDNLAALPITTIACINGAAIGGGLELALACDIRVCPPTAKFALSDLCLGLAPAAGGVRRLLAILGAARAKEIVMFGRELDAAQALDWGLVAYVGDDYQDRAFELAARACERDPMAMRLAKLALRPTVGAGELEALIQAVICERGLEYERELDERYES